MHSRPLGTDPPEQFWTEVAVPSRAGLEVGICPWDAGAKSSRREAASPVQTRVQDSAAPGWKIIDLEALVGQLGDDPHPIFQTPAQVDVRESICVGRNEATVAEVDPLAAAELELVRKEADGLPFVKNG